MYGVGIPIHTPPPPKNRLARTIYIAQRTSAHNCLRGSLYVYLQLSSLSLCGPHACMRARSFVGSALIPPPPFLQCGDSGIPPNPFADIWLYARRHHPTFIQGVGMHSQLLPPYAWQCRPQARTWPTAGSNSSMRGGNPAIPGLVTRLGPNMTKPSHMPLCLPHALETSETWKARKRRCASRVRHPSTGPFKANACCQTWKFRHICAALVAAFIVQDAAFCSAGRKSAQPGPAMLSWFRSLMLSLLRPCSPTIVLECHGSKSLCAASSHTFFTILWALRLYGITPRLTWELVTHCSSARVKVGMPSHGNLRTHAPFSDVQRCSELLERSPCPTLPHAATAGWPVMPAYWREALITGRLQQAFAASKGLGQCSCRHHWGLTGLISYCSYIRTLENGKPTFTKAELSMATYGDIATCGHFSEDWSCGSPGPPSSGRRRPCQFDVVGAEACRRLQ